MLCVLRTQGDVWCSGVTGLATDPQNARKQHYTTEPRLFWTGDPVATIALGAYDDSDPNNDPPSYPLAITTERGDVYLRYWNSPPQKLNIPAFTALVRLPPFFWGLGRDGRLFRLPSLSDNPEFLPGLPSFVQLTRHCARAAAGDVWCWNLRAPGDPTAPDVPSPEPALSPSLEIADSPQHVCSRKGDGSVWCKGNNYRGELGAPTSYGWSGAVQVSGLTDAARLAKGAQCAQRTDGSTWCWGQNFGLAQDPSAIRYIALNETTRVALPFRTTMPPYADTLVSTSFFSLCGQRGGELVCLRGDQSWVESNYGPALPNRLTAMGFRCD